MTNNNETRAMLAAMLTEPTGRSILDSGGIYGRNWERNAGETLATFDASPSATVSRYGITVSVFHYLAERLEYLPELDAQLGEFAETMPDAPWLHVAESFAETLGYVDESEVKRTGYAMRAESPTFRTWNTYNGEDLLSQVLQGVTLTNDGSYDGLTADGAVIFLQIHGGADVRGGYTRPRAFRVHCDMSDYFPYDNADAYVYCTDCDYRADIRNACDVTDRDGNPIDFDPYELPPLTVDGIEFVACPDCGKPLAADAPSAY